MRRALVLGGGGITGIAWEIGVVAGLVEAGVDLRAADLFIGTSAGSVVGALIASDLPLEQVYESQLTELGRSWMQHRVEAWAVQRQQLAVAQGHHVRVMALFEHAGRLAEKVAGSQHRDYHPVARPALDGELAAPIDDKEEAVANLVLGREHCPLGRVDRAQPPRQQPQDAVALREEGGSLLENGKPVCHVGRRRPLLPASAPLPARARRCLDGRRQQGPSVPDRPLPTWLVSQFQISSFRGDHSPCPRLPA